MGARRTFGCMTNATAACGNLRTPRNRRNGRAGRRMASSWRFSRIAAKSVKGAALKQRLREFFVRDDPQYGALVQRYQASTPGAKVFYLLLHVLPGFLVYAVINIPVVYQLVLRLTGLSGNNLQGWSVLAIFLGWHLITPLLVLRWADKLSFKDSLSFLGLARFDVKGFFLVLPVVSSWVAAVPGLNPPSYSIYRDPSAAYGLFPGWFVALALIGNFLGEEIYFRGYLMKKIGFLGSSAWVVNSVLFALYHMWQAPTTWALIGPAFVFGLLMQWRKNLYPLIAFHFLINIVWSAIIGSLLGS